MQAGVEFTHVVMTRFNLATPGRESSVRNQPGWLADRFQLFEKYCLPSMAAQTARNFHWVIYFDVDTPQEFRDRIEECRKVQPFTPYFTPLFPGSQWPVSVGEMVSVRTPWILTTHLDNDDGIATDYLARFQAALSGETAPVMANYNITNGYVFDGRRLYAHEHRRNAFASMLEPWDEHMRTVQSVPHMSMADYAPVVQIDGPGAWLQVVHGGNVSNRIRGRMVPPDEVRGRFPPQIATDFAEPGVAALRYDALVRQPVRRVRDMAIAVVRTLRKPG